MTILLETIYNIYKHGLGNRILAYTMTIKIVNNSFYADPQIFLSTSTFTFCFWN